MLYDLSNQLVLSILNALTSGRISAWEHQDIKIALNTPLPFAPLFPVRTLHIPRTDPDDDIESLTVTTVDNETLLTFLDEEKEIEFVLPQGYYIAKTKDAIPL